MQTSKPKVELRSKGKKTPLYKTFSEFKEKGSFDSQIGELYVASVCTIPEGFYVSRLQNFSSPLLKEQKKQFQNELRAELYERLFTNEGNLEQEIETGLQGFKIVEQTIEGEIKRCLSSGVSYDSIGEAVIAAAEKYALKTAKKGWQGDKVSEYNHLLVYLSRL
ncbi:hypothetical protein CL620_05385 [archaeon]|nr:hypothetical protein [archaeon]|tara:strand:- start:65 stop:556 length:492 start_codon:yes stop_codon:yes gene_type:complete